MLQKIKAKTNLFLEENILSNFGPKIIRLSPIGYACTNACPMCWRVMEKVTQKSGLRESELKYERYEKILDSLSFATSMIEVVGGGEPLLFPRIENLFKKIKKKRKIGSLITNGVVMNPKINAALVECKWDMVRISINAGTKDVYRMVNGANYFDLVIKNIENLIALRGNAKFPKIGFNFVIQKWNYKDIENFITLAEKIKIDWINFDTLITNSPKKITLSENEIEQLEKTLKIIAKKATVKNDIDKVLIKLKQDSISRKRNYFSNKYCQIVQSNLDINSEGAAVPCCMAYGESIEKNLKNDTDVNRIWKELAPFRKKLKQGQFEDFCYKKCNYLLEKR